jgi:hypothetical protein
MQEITLAMADGEFAVFASCFCRDMPIRNVQVLIDNEPQFDEDNKPVMTDYTALEWIKLYVVGQLQKKATKGYGKLVLDQNPPDAALMETMLSNL